VPRIIGLHLMVNFVYQGAIRYFFLVLKFEVLGDEVGIVLDDLFGVVFHVVLQQINVPAHNVHLPVDPPCQDDVIQAQIG